MKNSSRTLKKVAHFISINSEALHSIGLDGKMPMIYFLFCYGKRYKKQYYIDFAFEILEECLLNTLNHIQSTDIEKTISESTILQLGWSLQIFNKMGFFESEEMNEILMPFDKIAVGKAGLLPENIPLEDSIDEVLFLAAYLNERTLNLESHKTEKIQMAKCQVKIVNKVEKFLQLNAHENMQACGLLHFIKNTNTSFKNLPVFNWETVNTSDSNNLETFLFLYLSYPIVVKNNTRNIKLFWDSLIEKTECAIKSAYDINNKNCLDLLLLVANFGGGLLQKKDKMHRQYLANTLFQKVNIHKVHLQYEPKEA